MSAMLRWSSGNIVGASNPPGIYGGEYKAKKESSMTKVEKFTAKLRKLAAEAPQTLLVLPVNHVGLPDGEFIPESFLLYLADCFEGKVEGVPS